MLFLLSNPRDIPVDDLVSEEDVVIVTLSYRVNAFGFFSYEDQLMPGIFQFQLTLKKSFGLMAYRNMFCNRY